MRLTIENIIALLILMLTEAWLISSDYEWEPAIALIVAFSAIFAKEPVKKHFGWGGEPLRHDQRLFQDFVADLPPDSFIGFLDEHDFGDAFHRSRIRPLRDFVAVWGGVNKEFLDKKLEKLRKKLYLAAESLSNEIARRTVPVGDGDFYSVYSDNQRSMGPRSPDVIEDARVLNEMARDFIPIYESFFRSCKNRLED